MEDFFASSPTANLVSVTEKDTTDFLKGVENALNTFKKEFDIMRPLAWKHKLLIRIEIYDFTLKIFFESF